MNKLKQKNILKIITSIIIIIVLFLMIKNNLNSTDDITTITKSAGAFGPIILIALIMLAILFSPIPSVVVIVVAGYIYGPLRGAIYSYIGHFLGATMVYFIVKKFNIFSGIKKFEKYKQFVEKNKNMLYLFYAIPIIPITITSIIAATSEIKTKQFIQIASLSFIPAVMIFSFLGGKISQENMLELTALIVIIVVGTIIIIKKYKNRLEREIEHKLETNMRKVKKKKK